MNRPTTKRHTVHVTPATQRDVPALAHAHLRAFAKSPHSPIVSPQYVNVSTEELLRIGLPVEMNRLRQQIVGPTYSIKATVSTVNDRGETIETTAGYASWMSPDDARKRTLWEYFLSKIFYPIYNLFKPTPISESMPPVLELLEAQKKQVFGEGGIREGEKYWHLHLLFVDPDWQGFGISSALLQWGFDKARQTNSIIYLEASPMGLPVYLAKGFQIVSSLPRQVCDILVELPGMIWEP